MNMTIEQKANVYDDTNMTIEQKAQAYDVVVNKLRGFISKGVDPLITRNDVYDFFPVLKEESENERIRKNIKVALMSVEEELADFYSTHHTSQEELIAWLEKQEEPSPYTGVSFKYNGNTWGMCARDNGVDILLDKQLFTHLEKQGEQKSIVDNILTATDYDRMFQNCKVNKFNTGDWIVFNGLILHIDEFVNGYYRTTSIGGIQNSYDWDIDNVARLWSIQDAKDGDILAVEPIDGYQFPLITIYKNRGLDFFNSYCLVGFDDEFYEGTTGHALDNIHPATKEQRDILFSKMKEAGYVWDAEKKELRDIEQNSVDNIKPKFHDGDWITNGHCKCQITFIDSRYWYSETCVLGNVIDIDKTFHLWTIQDAKDGDVLVNGDEIVIFKKNSFNEKDLSGSMFVHCSLRDKKGSWYTIGGINPSNYLPATKAQRDKLFETMKEVGYEWDADKKELKKINSYCQEHCKGYQETGKCYADGDCEAKRKAEQNLSIDEGKAEMDYCFTKMMNGERVSSTWSEKDKKMSRFIGNAITADDASIYLENKGIQVIDAHVWLDELKDRVQPKKDWSEDDERIFSEIILRCKKYGHQEQIDWLKSLKERYTWKPNKDQMEALKCTIEDIAKFSKRYGPQVELENEPYYSALHSLYEQLRKLREE